MQDRRVNLERRERFEALRAAVMQRLQRVCPGWPRREIEQLAARMTRVKVKYESSGGMPA